jgi:hypothetical protein
MVSTASGQRLNELLEQREAETRVILRKGTMTRLNISHFCAPPRYYEIMTAYFPANLPSASQSSLRRIEGPLWLPRESGGGGSKLTNPEPRHDLLQLPEGLLICKLKHTLRETQTC